MRRDGNDGDLQIAGVGGRQRLCPPQLRGGKSIQLRQVAIHQHQIKCLVAQILQRLSAVACQRGLAVQFEQQTGKHLLNPWVVLNDQDACDAWCRGRHSCCR